MRKLRSGYYWVRVNQKDEWTIGKWTGRYPWVVLDSLGQYTRDRVAVIGDRIPLPQDEEDIIEVRRQRDCLHEALYWVLPLAEKGSTKPTHSGPCGPQESCDYDCASAIHDAEGIAYAKHSLSLCDYDELGELHGLWPRQLAERARKLCYAIEDAGASEQLTDASLMASDLYQLLAKIEDK